MVWGQVDPRTGIRDWSGTTYDPVTNTYYGGSGQALAPPGTVGGVIPGAEREYSMEIAPIRQQVTPWRIGDPTGIPAQLGPAAGLARAVTGPSPGEDLAAMLPGGVGAALTAAGLGSLALVAGGLYGVSQMVGVQYPWETGPGEGFISPFSRDIVKDENDRWVTRETRPDLFNGGASSTALAAAGAGGLAGVGTRVVRTWTTGKILPDGTRLPGWPFAMTSDANGKNKRIHTVDKYGVPRSWRPYKSVVLGKRMTLSAAKRAMGKLKSIKKIADDIEKLGGTRTVYRKA